MKITYTKKAKKDAEKIKTNKALKNKVKELLEIMETNPLQYPPDIEKLSGDLDGLYSRRINIKHRLVYEVNEEKQEVKILSMWSHYEF